MSEELEAYEPRPVPYISTPQHPPLLPPTNPDESDTLPLPAVLPSPPSTSLVPGALPARKKSRRGLWITFGIIVALLLASVASYLVISYVTRPVPDRLLDTFCSALQHEDYQSAYNQFSSKLQSTFSEATFASILSQDKVIACTHGTSVGFANSTITDLKLVHASGGITNVLVTLTRDSNNNWKIDDIRRQA
jgi:hypothetical protein